MPGPLIPALLLSALAVPTLGVDPHPHQAPVTVVTQAHAPGTHGAPADQRPGSDSASGTIAGVVTAPDDARLPGTTIRITNATTGWSLVVVTAAHGGYSGSGVPPGEYVIEAALDGFETQVAPRVTVTGGDTVVVNFRLVLSGVTETVEVVGAAVSDSIETSAIRESAARDIGEALSRMNGMAMVRKGAIANDVVLHGYQSRNLTVLIDGERIYGACPNGMDPAVFHADFAEVDHLEVGKGPFDVKRHGSLGGLVNVVTRAPGPGFHGTPSFSAGSFGFINPSVTASYGTAGVSVLGGYSYRTANPYRDGSGTLFTQYANYRPGEADSTAYDADTGWARLSLAPHRGHSAQIAYTRQHATHVLYPYLLMDGDSDDADRLNASYEIARDEGRIRTISARGYYSRVDHWMTDALRVSSVGAARDYSMATQANTSTVGGNAELGIGGVTAGVEIFRRRWDATTMLGAARYAPQYSIPFVTIDHAGFFAEYERPLGGRTRLDVGGRLDWSRSAADEAKAATDLYYAYKGTRSTSASDTGTSGRIRLIHQIGPALEIAGGIGHTERVPDPQERYFALKRMGTDWVGNPALRPTANTGLNLGLTVRHRRVAASANIYHDWLTDFIALHQQRKVNAVPGVMNSVSRSYANVDARMTNAELNLTWPLTDRLFATVDAAVTRGRKDPNVALGITSPYVAEIPPARGSVALRYDRAVVFVEAEGRFAATQEEVDTDLQEGQTPGYGVLNLRMGGQRKNLRVVVAVENVFDRLYVDHNSYQRDPFRSGVRVREPGRNLYTSISYRF